MATAQPVTVTPPGPQEITIRSHSNIFYMWPVWFIGLIFGLIVTPMSGHLLAVVPKDTKLEKPIEGEREVQVTVVDLKAQKEIKEKEVSVFIVPKDKEVAPPKLHISDNKNLGTWYLFITAMCIFFSTVTVRGWVAISIVSTIIFLVIIFNLTGVWERITTGLGFLDVRINQGGYIFFSTVLFIFWAIVIFAYDRQVKMTFTPRQVRVVQEVGDAEMVFDATGLNFQKLRTDPFRHWILGLAGAGDLVVRTGGAHPQTIEFPNVLFLHRRLQKIERLLQTQEVRAT
jgi:hypothetical protein